MGQFQSYEADELPDQYRRSRRKKGKSGKSDSKEEKPKKRGFSCFKRGGGDGKKSKKHDEWEAPPDIGRPNPWA